MKIAVSGASGLVGTALSSALTEQGNEVLPMVRHSGAEGIPWQPSRGVLDAADLKDVQAVVHLAGENVAGGRWTAARKKRILDSRVRGTRLLSETLASMAKPPTTLVCASAIGFYGDRDDEWMTEKSLKGRGFLADVCWRWEAAAAAARDAGIRVVHLRIGVVVSRHGGALTEMLRPFKFGLGGKMGSGRQFISWLHLDDLVGMIGHVLKHEEISGAVNAVAPEPVRQKSWAKQLGKQLRRPAIVPMPAFAVRAAFGEMGQELFLASTRVDSAYIQDQGFEFQYPDLAAAFSRELA